MAALVVSRCWDFDSRKEIRIFSFWLLEHLSPGKIMAFIDLTQRFIATCLGLASVSFSWSVYYDNFIASSRSFGRGSICCTATERECAKAGLSIHPRKHKLWFPGPLWYLSEGGSSSYTHCGTHSRLFASGVAGIIWNRIFYRIYWISHLQLPPSSQFFWHIDIATSLLRFRNMKCRKHCAKPGSNIR